MTPITIINQRINLRGIQAKLGQNLQQYYNIFGSDKAYMIRFDKLAIDKNFEL